jgi:hypothetical protein
MTDMTYEMGTEMIMCAGINNGYGNNGIRYPMKMWKG